jgi:succinoglycan biosynthesis protein ExoA
MTNAGRMPRVSLIVPMANERPYIRECLDGLESQDYPHERLEILIVDGGSTDGSRAIVNHAASEQPEFLRVFDNPRRITPVAFNIGIHAATGDLVGIVSAHSVLAGDYVSRCVEYLDRTGADHVGGLVTAIGLTPVARAIAESTNSPFAVGNSRFHYDTREQYVDSVYMGLYRREVFDRIGLFDEELIRNQDDEFNYRLHSANGRHFQTPRIRSKYYSRATYSQLWRQYFQYGVYKPLVFMKVPGAWRWRHVIPTAFVCVVAVGGMAAPFVPLVLKAWIGVLVVYGLIMSVGATRVARKHGWRAFPLSFAAFPILHVGYGTGFLLGLWRHWRIR